jgi:hypothetical protein
MLTWRPAARQSARRQFHTRRQVELSAICQQRRLAQPHVTPPPHGRQRLSPGRGVLEGEASQGDVRGPHSLHTAEVTGSIPVTPTSTNAFPESCCGAGCQQIASKPPTVVAPALKAVPSSGLWDGPVTPRPSSGPEVEGCDARSVRRSDPGYPVLPVRADGPGQHPDGDRPLGVGAARTSLDGPPPALLGSPKDHLSLHGSWGGPCAEG